jgi:hypothetical protein
MALGLLSNDCAVWPVFCSNDSGTLVDLRKLVNTRWLYDYHGTLLRKVT